MSMASSNIALLTDADKTKLGIVQSELTANVWAERQSNGNFAIYQNFQYQKYRNAFLTHFAPVMPGVGALETKGTRCCRFEAIYGKKSGHYVVRCSIFQGKSCLNKQKSILELPNDFTGEDT